MTRLLLGNTLRKQYSTLALDKVDHKSVHSLLNLASLVLESEPMAQAQDTGAQSPVSEASDNSEDSNFFNGVLDLRQPDELRKGFLKTLNDVSGSNVFARTENGVELLNLGLQINNLGRIGLPLSEHDAKAIISEARQSPFGKGDQTLVDQTVRKSWELNPTHFQLCNPAWQDAIQNIVSTVYESLDLMCGSSNVKVDLYKLLLYEEGAFFRSHRDSEKAPGMFGTLAICLPSLHEGGLLKLKHNGTEVRFDSSSNSEFGSSWSAWFSDVFHEVLPVTAGYRLVLTYNLIADRSRTSVPAAPDGMNDSNVPLEQLLRHWETNLTVPNSSHPKFLLYKLENQYTQASLKLNALVGQDLNRARLLYEVATEQGATLYLANLKKTLHKDDDCGDKVFNTDFELTYAVDMDGQKIAATIDVPEDHILEFGSGDFDEDDYDGSEHEGYTGNEGSPSRYWYNDTVSHRAVFEPA